MKPLAVMILAAVIATAAGTTGSRHRDHFSVPLGIRGTGAGPGLSPDADQVFLARQELRNTLLVDSLIGASVVTILAVAAAFLAGRPLIAGAAGLVTGALAGALGGYLGLLVRNNIRFDELAPAFAALQTPIVHFLLWMLIGAALAISVGLSTQRQWITPLLGQFALYSLIAAAIFSPIAALLFPMLNSDRPIPEGYTNTAIWIGIPTLLFGFGISRMFRPAPAGAPANGPDASAHA